MQRSHKSSNRSIRDISSQAENRATSIKFDSKVSSPKRICFRDHSGKMVASSGADTTIGIGKGIELNIDKDCEASMSQWKKPILASAAPRTFMLSEAETSPMHKYTQQLLNGRSIAQIVDDRIATHESFLLLSDLGDHDFDDSESFDSNDTDGCPPLEDNLRQMRSFM